MHQKEENSREFAEGREAKTLVSKMAQQIQALEYTPKDPSLIFELHKMVKRSVLMVVTSKYKLS